MSILFYKIHNELNQFMYQAEHMLQMNFILLANLADHKKTSRVVRKPFYLHAKQ